MELIKKIFFFLLIITPSVLFAQEIVDSQNVTLQNTQEVITSLSEEDGNSVPAEQEEVISEYSLNKTEDGVIFIQRLFWDHNDYVLKYNVVIEKLKIEDSSWEEVVNQDTKESFIEVSLKVGNYHYKVISYNFLGKIEEQTDWIDFEIIKAIQPEINSATPSNIWLEERNDGLFRISGKDLSDKTVFQLRGTGLLKYTITGTISKIAENGKSAEIQFPVDALDTGIYQFTVTNPGGLDDSEGPITIKFKKAMDFDISTGYSPALLLQNSSEEYKSFTDYFGVNFIAYTPTVRLTWIFLKKRFGFFGINLTPSFFRIINKQEGYSLSTNIWNANLNFVYQYPIIKQRLIVDTHLGMGVMFFQGMIFNFGNSISSPELNSWNLSASVGVALQGYITNRLYCELGCDYSLGFLPNNYSLGVLIPYASVGWQF